jgi:hypothetical protein
MKTVKHLAVAATFGLCACAQIPTKQLTSYTQAFAQAQAASEQVLLDFDQALKEARATQQALVKPAAAPMSPSPYPRSWADAVRSEASAVPDDIEVRRRAFKIVADYNAVLVQLAEGKSVEDVKTSASGLLSSADKFLTVVKGSGIPGLSSITGIVTTLAELFEKARLREEFVKAVQNGAPIVDKILDAFIADIGSHYDARVAVLNRERLRALSRMRSADETARKIVSQHNATSGDRDKLESAVNEKLAVALGDGIKLPVKLAAASSNTPAYSDIAKAQVQDELNTLDRQSKVYVENIAAAKSLSAMLGSYRKLLEATQASMKALVKSLTEPVDIVASADELLGVAFALRRDLRALNSALAEQ